jgi:hypothetical protein
LSLRLLPFVLLLTVACSTLSLPPEDTERRDALNAAADAARPGDELTLTDVLGNDWDRASFFGPYYTNDQARQDLGFDFDIEKASPWTYTEGGVVIVLSRGPALVDWLAVPTPDIGLHCLENGEVLAVEDATLLVTQDESGFKELIDPDRPPCPAVVSGDIPGR